MSTKLAGTEHGTKLADIIARVRDTIKTALTGGLMAAESIVALGKNWEHYRAEAEGVDCTTFLQKTLGAGYTLDWFTRRHNAVMLIAGNDSATARSLRTHIADDAAIWLAGRATLKPHYDAIVTAVRRLYKKQSDTPVKRTQVIRLANAMTKHVASKAECVRCKAMAAQLLALGVDPVE